MRILNVVYCSMRLSVVNVVTAGARLRFTLDVRASSVAFTAVARRLVVSIIWVHTIVIQKAAQYTHARSHTYVSACTMATALEHVSAKGGAPHGGPSPQRSRATLLLLLLFSPNPNVKLIVVHNSYCCSVVTVNTTNTVQPLTLRCSTTDMRKKSDPLVALLSHQFTYNEPKLAKRE